MAIQLLVALHSSVTVATGQVTLDICLEIALRILRGVIVIVVLAAVGPAGLHAASSRVSRLSLAGLEIEREAKVEAARSSRLPTLVRIAVARSNEGWCEGG